MFYVFDGSLRALRGAEIQEFPQTFSIDRPPSRKFPFVWRTGTGLPTRFEGEPAGGTDEGKLKQGVIYAITKLMQERAERAYRIA
jgi:hypothetical protein